MLKALNKYPQCISKHANYFFMLGCVSLQCCALVKGFSVTVLSILFSLLVFLTSVSDLLRYGEIVFKVTYRAKFAVLQQ